MKIFFLYLFAALLTSCGDAAPPSPKHALAGATLSGTTASIATQPRTPIRIQGYRHWYDVTASGDIVTVLKKFNGSKATYSVKDEIFL